MIVAYAVPDTEKAVENAVLIPLDASGRPTDPFGFPRGRLLADLSTEPGAEQIDRFERVRFTTEDFRVGFACVASRESSKNNSIDGATWRMLGYRDGDREFAVLNLVSFDKGMFGHVWSVALPAHQARPLKQLLRDRTFAVVATPIAVVYDMVTAPIMAYVGFVWQASINDRS